MAKKIKFLFEFIHYIIIYTYARIKDYNYKKKYYNFSLKNIYAHRLINIIIFVKFIIIIINIILLYYYIYIS
jgi:hypothetical protein